TLETYQYSLLPKKGDLFWLKKGRSISLANNNTKAFTCLVNNCLMSVLSCEKSLS
ncbi:hypothetical protein BY458DRAFT_446569, partial [Sporodiniella umbellata]